MADETQETPDLAQLGEIWAESVSEDLSGLFDTRVSISGPQVEAAQRETLLGSRGSVVCSSCGEDLYFVLSLEAALALAAAQLGKGPEEFESFRQSTFDGDVEEAYQSAMDVCVGIFGRVLDEEAGLPSVQLVESALVDLAGPVSAPEPGIYRRARFGMEIEGFPDQPLDILVGGDRGRDWFGEPACGEETARPGGPIALLDPDPDSRDAFSSLADALGREVLTLDPDEFDDRTLEELALASSVVLTWDLGGRPGLDVVEEIRANESTAELRIALASQKPTRALVDAALRWGAHTVLLQPWDADEISKRLLE